MRVAAGEAPSPIVLVRGVREILAQHVEEARERRRDGVGPDAPRSAPAPRRRPRPPRRAAASPPADEPRAAPPAPPRVRPRSAATRRRSRPPRERSRRRLEVAGEGAQPGLVPIETLGRVGPLDRRDVAERARPVRRCGSRRRAGRSGAPPRASACVAIASTTSIVVRRVMSSAVAIDRGELLERGPVPALRRSRGRPRRCRGGGRRSARRRSRSRTIGLPLEQLLPASVGERACAVGVGHVVLASRSESQEPKRTRAVHLQRRRRR